MPVPSIVGQTVAFVGCPAEDQAGSSEIKLDGLFVVDEWVPTDPGAYQWEPGFIVARPGCPDGMSYFVNAYEFTKQVWPKTHARELVQEREMAFAAEEDWR